jgi:hypothetical protein
VDVVANGGLLWVKVSTISQKRLVMEMAKQGWECFESMSDDDDDDLGDGDQDGNAMANPQLPDNEVSIVKMAMRLVQEAQNARVNYKHPSVSIELPRIQVGAHAAIDNLLDQIRNLGITVVCGPQPARTPPPTADGTPPAALMLYDVFSHITPRVNIDCTILLALSSDISHSNDLEKLSWLNRALRRQLEIEKKECLIPSVMWPALAGRDLVCTREAAKRMREITGLIGTDSEKERMAVILDEGPSGEEKREQLRALSKHEVPDDLRLPVSVCERVGLEDGRLPPVAKHVAQELTDINRSVFLFGWAEGITTITSNKSSANIVAVTIKKHRTRDDEVGPDVYVCTPSRSLVAKEKVRKE